jgi:hypothetical protein
MMQLGKLLVLATVALSTVFLAWSIGVYTEHVDFVKPADAPAETKGKLEELTDLKTGVITALASERTSLFLRWVSVEHSLRDAEAVRQPRKDWYGQELKIIASGTDTAGNPVTPSVRELPPLVDGLFDIKPRARAPVAYNGRPLESHDAYQKQLKSTFAKIDEWQKEVAKLIEEEQRLTERLNGSPTVGKGLRDLFAEQVAAAQGSVEEQEYLRGLVANRKAEEQLVQKRNAALKARVDALKSKLGPRGGTAPGN